MLTVPILGVAFTLATGRLVGRVPAAAGAGAGSPELEATLSALVVVGVVYGLQQVIPAFVQNADLRLQHRVDRAMTTRVMNAVAAPVGIAHLEDPAILDEIEKGLGNLRGRSAGVAAVQLLNVWGTRLAGIGAVVLVARFSILLAAALAAVAVLERKFWIKRYDDVTTAIFNRGQIHRRTIYFRQMALTPEPAKEVRAFGLSGWLSGRFRSTWAESMAPVWPKMKGAPLRTTVFVALPLAIRVAGYLVMVRAALRGSIGIGEVAILMRSIAEVSALGSSGDNDHSISEGVATLPVALALEEKLQRMRADAAAGVLPSAGAPQRSVRFDGVHFTYPGRDNEVFSGLDLEIEAGTSVAIVGDNGAGKTTLVKLLARLHEPTDGRIVVDGIDLTTMDPEAWQRRVAAIFQDFIHYALPARDNVTLGAPERQDDTALLESAARRAGVAEMIESLPHGWDTPLSRQLTDGTEPSGGQWQRIALARALFAVEAGAGILVLDEPTANLDVRTEAELYDRFLDITKGLTTIVISHRFSTVRRADRIVVISGGVVVEDGSHDQLMAAGGEYARRFTLQAERYRDDDGRGDAAGEGERDGRGVATHG